MIAKIFLSILIAAFLVCDAGAGTLQTKQAQVLAKKNAVASCAGSCCDSFARTDNADCIAGSLLAWDSETDVGGKLSIASNYLSYDAGTANSNGYLTETANCFASAQNTVTVKFTLKTPATFTSVSAANGVLTTVKLLNASSQGVAYFVLAADASGNLKYLKTYLYTGNTYRGVGSTDISSLSTSTDYTCYLYFTSNGLNSSTASAKIGALDEASYTYAAAESISQLQMCGISNGWGGGDTDVTINIKEMTTYLNDTR